MNENIFVFLPQTAESFQRRRKDRQYASEHFGLPMHLLNDEEKWQLPLWHCLATYRYEITFIPKVR